MLLQKQDISVKTWKAGMRLEALDRKTPTLICVATVGMLTDFVYCILSEVVLYAASCSRPFLLLLFIINTE